MSEYRLEMRGVCKSFPGVKALDHAQLCLHPGKVHALMGENGAGKSTLMKCMFGIYSMDEGEIYYEGKKVTIKDPLEALKMGIAMVHQELQPIPARTIGENIFLGRYPMKKFLGFIPVVDHEKMYADTAALLKKVRMNFDPRQKVGELSVSQMQSVEIAKAVSANCKVLILDEPTSSLTANEVEALFRIIEDLKADGVSIVYISHKMDEILRISDEVTIMRDGHYIGTWDCKGLTTDFIISKMVGRELTNLYPERHNVPGEVVFEVEDFTSINPRSFRHVNFNVRKGEILGFAGLVGAGRTETMRLVCGADPMDAGVIRVNGKEAKIRSPKDAVRYGIGYLSEDRKRYGLCLNLSVTDNTVLPSLEQLFRGPFVNDGKADRHAQDYVEKIRTKTPNTRARVGSLSGGNQQKVVISKWLLRDCDVLIFDEPTRGIDVGAKSEIYKLMTQLAEEGKAIIMISSDMPELLRLSDRVIVMCEGHVTGELDISEATQESIMTYATKREEG